MLLDWISEHFSGGGSGYIIFLHICKNTKFQETVLGVCTVFPSFLPRSPLHSEG